MTYQKRNLKFQFKLSSGNFDDKGNDTLTIENIKAEVQVAAFGSLSASTLDARVYGLSLDQMGLIGYKGVQYGVTTQNSMKIWANDIPIFSGTIGWCIADPNEMPDAALIIQASSTGFIQSKRADDFNKQGEVKVADIFKSIASLIDLVVNVSSSITEIELNPITPETTWIKS